MGLKLRVYRGSHQSKRATARLNTHAHTQWVWNLGSPPSTSFWAASPATQLRYVLSSVGALRERAWRATTPPPRFGRPGESLLPLLLLRMLLGCWDWSSPCGEASCSYKEARCCYYAFDSFAAFSSFFCITVPVPCQYLHVHASAAFSSEVQGLHDERSSLKKYDCSPVHKVNQVHDWKDGVCCSWCM